MSQHPARVFLGWDESLLDRAADWLIQEFGEDCSEVIVALPGGRAGRMLQEKLARKAKASWIPPRVLTQGALTDMLVSLDVDVADRVVRTLVWERALHSAPTSALTRLLRNTPAADDGGAWNRLAEILRTLHGELAPEGCSFERVAELLAQQGNSGESARWKTLASIQDSYRKQLSELGLADPHESRFAAIHKGLVVCRKQIVLVGVADMNHLLRRALESVPERVTALVFAPEEEAGGFDEWGCLRVELWKDRNIPLTREQWLVADKPGDQARLVTEWLAEQGADLRAAQVTIGIADEEVAPYLERRFAEVGIRTRHAAGVAPSRTLPFRLLEATASYVQSKSWEDWAALVRHPNLERLLGGADAAGVSDAYHGEFLPDRIEQEVYGHTKNAAAMRSVCEVIHEALAGLVQTQVLPLSGWSEVIRAYLMRIYGESEFDEECETQRVTAASLKELGAILTRLEALPEQLVLEACSAGDALGFVLRELRSSFIPPAVSSASEPTVELLGWLELPLDDADYLVVTGFSDGKVPESMAGDPFLPNGLRSALELVDADGRQARDVHELTVLCHSRKAVFVTGRRTASGDPLAPSRLAFHCEPQETPERVRQFLAVGVTPRVEVENSKASADPHFPGRKGVETPNALRVTAFRDFLNSPYQFYLRHILNLETLDDDARELDAAQFGTLAHDVLKAFGESQEREALDARTIEKSLQSNLQRLARARYGKRPVPAALLQIEQLSYRFHLFAERQEEWIREGWRIQEVEWAPEGGGKSLDVDGEPILIRGRIDRIDRHSRTGQYAILDYKTSDKAKSPATEHYAVRAGYWRDLQLPLYCHLTSSFEMEQLPLLGYVNLGCDASSVRFWMVEGWDEDRITEAEEEARSIVRRIREGDFFGDNQGRAYDHITQALCGVGVLDVGEDDDEEEEQ